MPLRQPTAFSVEDSKLGACHQSLTEGHQCLLSRVEHRLRSRRSAARPSALTEWPSSLSPWSLTTLSSRSLSALPYRSLACLPALGSRPLGTLSSGTLLPTGTLCSRAALTVWSEASGSLESAKTLACRAALLSAGSVSLSREVPSSLWHEAVVELKAGHNFAIGGRSTVGQQKGVADLLSGCAEFLGQMHRHAASLLNDKRIIHQEERLRGHAG